MTTGFYIAAKPWGAWYAGRGVGMRLSEAILEGCKRWPETHHERFVRRADGVLCADVWGAAVGVVAPWVASLNWDWLHAPDKAKTSQGRLLEVQMRYFGRYFQMPAQCPGATQPYQKARGRVVNRRGDVKIEDGAKVLDAGGMTSECDMVEHLAGAIDHLFYAHNWSREQVAEIVEWYEETRTDAALAQMFTHFRAPALESRIHRRLLAKAKAKIERRNERRNFVVN